MFIIGIDPHKGSHTAVAVDQFESVIDTIRVDADRHACLSKVAPADP
jgi:hypothetical protein